MRGKHGDDHALPTGRAEFDLLRASAISACPPRLAHRPIVHPVMNEAYAAQIARDRNTRAAASGYVGSVMRLRVRALFLDRYTPQIVGGK